MHSVRQINRHTKCRPKNTLISTCTLRFSISTDNCPSNMLIERRNAHFYNASIGELTHTPHVTVMRFALFDSQRIEATPNVTGTCPGCGAELVARCGTKKIWHWAHKGRRHCDHWWENETQWHRDWKNQFDPSWQEVSARDVTGELHIADIKTPYGLTVEFQHSAIKPEEVIKRTQFYGHVVWVVDATRRPTDIK